MDTEIPEICKEYDLLSEQISSLEEGIPTLKEGITEKIERIKEYLQILIDATEAGLNPPDVAHGSVEYFEKKIRELDEELLYDDEIIKDSEKKLSKMKKELEELTVKIKDAGYSKLYFPLSGCVWYPENEAEKYIKNPFVRWIV